MSKNHQWYFKKGFTIVELLVVIVIIGILAAIATASYSGVNEKANRAVAVVDLNNVHTLVENYQTINANLPSSIDDTNDGQGYDESEGSIVRYTATGLNYCITVNRGSYYIMYDSATGENQDGYCEGHGPAEPAEIAYFSGMNLYSTGSTTYPLTPGVALQDGDVVVSFHVEHYILGGAYLKVNGTNQSYTLDKQLGTAVDRFRVTVVTNVTPSTLLSFTTDSGGGSYMSYYVIRGVNSPAVYSHMEGGWSGGMLSDGAIVTIPSQSLKNGQVAILALNAIYTDGTQFPYNPDPSIANWITDYKYPGGSREMGLVHVIGTNDTTSVASSILNTRGNYIGGTIFVFGS